MPMQGRPFATLDTRHPTLGCHATHTSTSKGNKTNGNCTVAVSGRCCGCNTSSLQKENDRIITGVTSYGRKVAFIQCHTRKLRFGIQFGNVRLFDELFERATGGAKRTFTPKFV